MPRWTEFNPTDPWNKIKNITESTDDGYIYYAGNNLSKYKITVTLKFKKMQNLRISKKMTNLTPLFSPTC